MVRRKAEKMRAMPAILRICDIPDGLSRPTCRW
jgi:hypothetical protein